MKPRTATELDYWMRIGLSPEDGDRYMAEHPQEHAQFGFAYAGVRLYPEKYRSFHASGPQERIQDMRAPDGRLVYPEMAGLMKNSRDYNR